MKPKTTSFTRSGIDFSKPCDHPGCGMCLGHPGEHGPGRPIFTKTVEDLNREHQLATGCDLYPPDGTEAPSTPWPPSPRAISTPGPWVVYNQSQDGKGRLESEIYNGSRTVAEVRQTVVGRSYLELEANARLMAAAPDLLAFALAAKPIIEQELESRQFSGNDEYIDDVANLLVLCLGAIAHATQP